MLTAPLALMAAAAVAAPFLARRLGRHTGYVLSAVFVAAMTLILIQAPDVLSGGQVTSSWAWVPEFGVEFSLRLNGLALLFAVLVLVAHVVTVPLSGLVIGRAAYRSGTARPPVTRIDEPAARAEADGAEGAQR